MKKHSILMPPIWLALVLSFVGIIGMNLVYQSLTSGGVVKGVIGGVLLVLGVITVGTPLAFARMYRKDLRETKQP